MSSKSQNMMLARGLAFSAGWSFRSKGKTRVTRNRNDAGSEIRMRLMMCLTIFLLLTSCSDKRIISVHVDVGRLTIDDSEIHKDDFEEVLRATIDSLEDSGLHKSMIKINVLADRRISTYEMSEIEKAIRRQGVKRDYFWRSETRERQASE